MNSNEMTNDATASPRGTDSDTANCTMIPRSQEAEVTNLLSAFGRALSVTDPLPGSLLSPAEGWQLSRIRRVREAKQMVMLNDVDFLLGLLTKLGV